MIAFPWEAVFLDLGLDATRDGILSFLFRKRDIEFVQGKGQWMVPIGEWLDLEETEKNSSQI